MLKKALNLWNCEPLFFEQIMPMHFPSVAANQLGNCQLLVILIIS